MRTALITGATSGIGAAAARRLGARGWRVLVHGRDRERGEAVAADVADAGGEGVFLRADFSDLGAVGRLAREAADFEPAVLVNNAGLSHGRRHTADLDGRVVEETFLVNHLAPYRLTHDLLDDLRRATDPRVVVTASGVHFRADDPLGDLAMREYDALEAYARSKLANVAFTLELADRLADRSPDGTTRVTANACHPGFVPGSRLFRRSSLRLRLVTRLAAVVPFVGTPADRGAGELVRLAADEAGGDVSGAYFSGGEPTAPSALARDPGFRDRLWTESADLVGVDPDWP